MNAKQAAAFKAVSYVEDGMIVGLGTGSTAYWAIEYLAQRITGGLKVTTVATSEQTAQIAKEKGIEVLALDTVDHIDIDIDGADEADADMQLIKGGGGALLREKIVAAASKKFIVIIDENKLVQQLGRFPLPVEIVPFGWKHTEKLIAASGCTPILRLKDETPFITDNGNYILDCHYNAINDAPALHQHLNNLPGVVENGLFIGLAERLVIGYNDGNSTEITARADA